MDQFDLWQVIPKQVFTPLISTSFIVVSRVGCVGVSVWSHVLQNVEEISFSAFFSS